MNQYESIFNYIHITITWINMVISYDTLFAYTFKLRKDPSRFARFSFTYRLDLGAMQSTLSDA